MNFLKTLIDRLFHVLARYKNKAIITAAADTGGAGIDLLLNLPLATPVLAAFRLKSALASAFFNDKVRAFVLNAGEIDQHHKVQFLQSLDKDAEGFTKNLLLTIDRLDDAEKAAIIGRLFRVAVINFLPLTAFRRLSAIIDRAYIDDLALLPLIYDKEGNMHQGDPRGHVITKYKIKQPDQHASLKALAHAGLLVERPMQSKMLAGFPTYRPNELGLALLKFGFE